jgi:hypothetical protein
MIVSYLYILPYLTTGRESFISRNGPLSTYRICHNKFEDLPQIDFRIIVTPILNWEIKRGTSLEYIVIFSFFFQKFGGFFLMSRLERGELNDHSFTGRSKDHSGEGSC